MSMNRQMALGTEAELLKGSAYGSADKYNGRVSIFEFQQPRHDAYGIALGCTSWPDGAVVLDVGCGPGNYVRRLRTQASGVRIVGVDLSYGMVAETNTIAGVSVVEGDVERLPFPNDAFDRVLAMHMLYHAADLDGAVRELRRVLRPDGVVLISTNAIGHHHGLFETLRVAAGVQAWHHFTDRFVLENAEAPLRRQFESVELVRFQAELVLTDPEPAVRFVDSTDTYLASQLPPGAAWLDVIGRFRQLLADEIATNGEWRSPTDSGVFVCR